jgi:hypothetical protein
MRSACYTPTTSTNDSSARRRKARRYRPYMCSPALHALDVRAMPHRFLTGGQTIAALTADDEALCTGFGETFPVFSNVISGQRRSKSDTAQIQKSERLVQSKQIPATAFKKIPTSAAQGCSTGARRLAFYAYERNFPKDTTTHTANYRSLRGQAKGNRIKVTGSLCAFS